MAMVGQAYTSFFQFGRESTWGTAVAATHRIPCNRIDPQAVIGRVRPKTLDGGLSQPAIVAGGIMGRVTAEFPFTYTGLQLIADGFMGTGTYGSNGGATTGGPNYTHTWSAFARYLNSYTLQMGVGDIPTGKCERLVGAKIATFNLKGSAGLAPDDHLCTATVEFVGKTLADDQTPTSSLNSAVDYVLFSHIDAATIASDSSPQILSFDLTVNTGIPTDGRFYSGLSGATAEFQRKVRPTYRLEVEAEFEDKTSLDDWIANTAGTVSLQFTSGNKQLTFSCTGAHVEPVRHPVEGDDFVRQRMVLEGQTNGSGSTLACTITNTQALITTAV